VRGLLRGTRSQVAADQCAAERWLVRCEGWIAPEGLDHLPEPVDMLLNTGLVHHGVQERLAFADEQNILDLPSLILGGILKHLNRVK
jgi:hypothetical protein